MSSKPTRKPPSRRTPPRRPRRPRLLLYQATRLIPVLIVVAAILNTVIVLGDAPAYAAEPQEPGGPESIEAVINNIRFWLVGILVAVATLFLTVGGLRYLAANGDPSETEKGKLAMKSAAIGYALALLAPLFVTIVGGWVK
ncbi:pilin [Micromonospora sp. RP3T]|uniref:pilin n=1 Tax=Micromonospora sp. RP3T TaxID=2135446 RepID=UPI003D7069AC